MTPLHSAAQNCDPDAKREIGEDDRAGDLCFPKQAEEIHVDQIDQEQGH